LTSANRSSKPGSFAYVMEADYSVSR
jgi:hypothetical protein